MSETQRRVRSVILAILAVSLASLTYAQRHKNEQPKNLVLPLPPEPPKALLAETATLDFHISQLLQSGGLAEQIRHSLENLLRDTRGETILKLRAFVAGAGDARRVQATVAEIFTSHKLPLPVLSVIQVGALGEGGAKVVIEGVVSTHKTVNPNGLAFFAGQTGASLANARQQLKDAIVAAAIAPENVLRVTCFTSRMEDFSSRRQELSALFPHASVNLVQAVRDPLSDESTCEAIGQLPRTPPEGPVVLWKDKRAALVSAPKLVLTGLQLSFGSFLDDAHEAIMRLERSATSLEPVEAPIEVNVFSLDPTGGSALRKTTAVPPSTFTVQTVEGLPAVDASAGIEAVLVPGVETPAAR